MCKQNKVVKLDQRRGEKTDQSEGCSFTFSQPEDQLLNGKLDILSAQSSVSTNWSPLSSPSMEINLSNVHSPAIHVRRHPP